ncbi:MAG: hypothetical protein ACF8QF_13865 [Phycisphaerales bacterium]
MCCKQNGLVGALIGIGAGFATLATMLPTATEAGAAQPATTEQSAPAMSADQVLAKAVEATYGEVAKTRSIRSVRMTGAFEMAAMGIGGDVVTIMDLDSGQVVSRTNIAGMGEEAQGITDDIAWANSSTQGPRLLDGQEREQLERQSSLYNDVDWRESFTGREYIGSEEVDGVQCHVVSLTPATGGKPIKRWYDAESFILRQQQFTISSPMGEVTAVAKMTDYREVAGVQMAFKTVNSFAGIQQVLEFTSIEPNIEIDESTFALPAPVQRLVDKRNAEQPAGE